MEPVSIIIPSYRSAATLSQCLSKVTEQLKPIDAEIIVVDSSPEGLPPSIKSAYATVKFIENKERLYAGSARNLGFRNSQNPILCFLDSDCLWNESWLEGAQTAMRTFPEWLAFTGPVLSRDSQESPAFLLHLLEFHEYTSRQIRNPRFLSSGNLMIRRSFFEKIGGYREDIPMCTDFTFTSKIDQQLLRRAYFLPEMSVTHLSNLVDRREVQKKIHEMGYWRGKVESQIPFKLQIQTRWWFYPSKLVLGPVFFVAILLRTLYQGSIYRTSYLAKSFRLFKVCVIWAEGFIAGLEARTKKQDDNAPSWATGKIAQRFKQGLVSLGRVSPKIFLQILDSTLHYLEGGRWLRDRNFKEAPRCVRSKDEIFNFLAKQAKEGSVLYLEFGVFEGASMRKFLSLVENPQAMFHGFDSFEGLPENWNHFDPKFKFSTGGRVPDFKDSRVKIWTGFFEETLKSYIPPKSDLVIVNIDCDLYSSSICVLRNLASHLKVGSFLYFDEFYDRHHERKAFTEFLEATGFEFDFVMATQGMANALFRRVR